MLREKLIASEQAEMVDLKKLATFFATPLGIKLQKSVHVLREFKFSLLENGEKFYSDAQGEQVLLQGVVDCALLEADGITVLDFKTDRVTEKTLPAVAERYRPQVITYADALERIYQMPVKAVKLYFFDIERFWDII